MPYEKKKRQNRVQKELNSSTRTGTKKREKKKNYCGHSLHINRLIRTSPSGGNKEKRVDLEYGLSYEHEDTKRMIKESTNDEVILALNAKGMKKQRISAKELAMILNRVNMPPDLTNIIVSYALNNIRIEKNIFKVIPQDMLEVFHSKEEYEIEEKEKQVDKLINKYKHNLHILEFLQSVLIDDICEIRWWKSSSRMNSGPNSIYYRRPVLRNNIPNIISTIPSGWLY